MSHSKFHKHGSSLYLEHWNPAAGKYVLTRSLCGITGYSPTLDQPDFLALSPKTG